MKFFTYYKFALMKLIDELQYRVDFIFRLLTGFLSSYVFVKVWEVASTSSIIEVSHAEAASILSYVIMARSFALLFDWQYQVAILNESGDIARYLVYPANFQMALYAQHLGRHVATVFTRVIPTLIFLLAVFGIPFTVRWDSLLFALFYFAIGGFVLTQAYLIVDMWSIWIINIFGPTYVMHGLVSLSSGSLIPLWLLPEPIRTICYWLPFRYMIDTPVNLIMGKVTVMESVQPLIGLTAWAAILCFTTTLVWKLAQRRLVVYGG